MEDLMTGLTKSITVSITFEEAKMLKELEDKYPAISRRKVFVAGMKSLLENSGKMS